MCSKRHDMPGPGRTPKVSFVLPAWKGRHLAASIESILAQTFRDFELIVADDCSPDGIEDIVRAFRDPRISFFRNPENVGGDNLAAAWNLAFSRARGEFAVLASDDDFYSPRFLETMLELAGRHPRTDLFHCRARYIDGTGRETGLSRVRAEFESPAEFVFNRGVRRMEQTAPDFMFRSRALRDAGGFADFERGWFSDDATWMLLARRGGAAYSPKTLFTCRRADGITDGHSDAPAKIRAAESFKKWFASFLPAVAPLCENDRAMLEVARNAVPLAVDAVSFWSLRHAPASKIAEAFASFEGAGARTAFALRMIRAASFAVLRRAGLRPALHAPSRCLPHGMV